MFRYYYPRIRKILKSLHRAKENPFENKLIWLEIQEELIKSITIIERKIKDNKINRKNLKSELGNPTNKLKKEKASIKKKKLKYIEFKLSEYNKLLFIFKGIGDSIAHTFINRFDLKPISLNSNPGFISNKKGNRLERAILRTIFKFDNIGILCDLTNTLKHYDILLVRDYDIWVPIECKSGKNINSRIIRQKNKAEKLVNFLKREIPSEVNVENNKLYRQEFSEIIHYNKKINELITKSKKSGLVVESIENGLVYAVNYNKTYDANTFIKLIEEKNLHHPMIHRYNQSYFDSVSYYPLPLILKEPEYYIDFLKNELELFVFFDYLPIKKELEEKNVKLNLINDSNFIFSIDYQINNEEFQIKFGKHLFFRILYEFLSPSYIFHEITKQRIKMH